MGEKSDNASGAQTQTAKGRVFEDEVAEVYRLLGAEVVQNIEICQKKVDLMATFPIHGSRISHRVIVECKDEAKVRNANQRVMQFQGLLDIARRAGEADSAEIITRVPWSDAAMGFAKTAGISLLTFSEKLSQLIDFRPYLRDLVDQFVTEPAQRPDNPPLYKYYVDLSAQRLSGRHVQTLPIVNTYIAEWLKQDTPHRHLILLGEYGAGKTSLCSKIAHDMAVAYLNDQRSNRIPILLNLREFVGTIRLEAFIASFLDQECRVINPKFQLFKAMNAAGLFLLILDGLDEMAVKVDADVLELNLIEIEKLASPASKILLTGRPEYFLNEQEVKNAIAPQMNVFQTRTVEYEPIKILPWNDNQIDTFLSLRVPLVPNVEHHWTFYRDQIRSLSTLSDLSERPVLLEMIVTTLPSLIQKNIQIDLPKLYETYLRQEIRRQKILKRRRLLVSDDSRLNLLQRLAIDVYIDKISAISFQDASLLIQSKLDPPRQELEYYTRDFLTSSFLLRKGDFYYFSHQSILEYLVAQQLSQEIRDVRPDYFSRTPLQPAIINFLIELKPKLDTLWNWIEDSKHLFEDKNRFLGGNAATLLCAMSRDIFKERSLEGTHLAKVNLSFADLRTTVLKGTRFSDVKLDRALFHRKDLEKAHISNAQLTFYFKLEDEERPDLAKFLNRNHFSSSGRKIDVGDVYDNSRSSGLRHITTIVRNLADAEAVRHELYTYLLKPIALFHEEYQKLLTQ